MYLEELINTLGQHDPAKVVRLGFNNPHSYRGYYECVAFEPSANVTIGSMLAAAREALGSTYEGYKGGRFSMDRWVDCYLAHEGLTGDELSHRLLAYMLADELLQEEA